MKKNSIIATVFGIVGSALLLSSPISKEINIIQSNETNQLSQTKDDDYVTKIYVSNAQELKNALLSQPTNDYIEKEIYLTQDIDLSKATSTDLNLSIPYWSRLTIDGQGHSIKNKPSDLFFQPIGNYYLRSSIYQLSPETFSVKNITFDNVGSIFGRLEVTALNDLSVQQPSDIYGIGINFQNITIKNSHLNDEKINSTNNVTDDWEQANIEIGLLANEININHNGNATYDESVNFYNIHIENNIIENNDIVIQPNMDLINDDGSYLPIVSSSFSFFTNIKFDVCSTAWHSHESYINFEYIFINDNIFKNNTYINSLDGTKLVIPEESASSFIGSIMGLGSWTGSGGNYIYISNIFLSNNIIGSSTNITKNKFNYSELISTFGNNSNQWLNFELFENIFSFNNESYTFDKNGNEIELTYEDMIPIINLNLESNEGNSNSWDEYNSEDLFFYGDMFAKNYNLNLFSNNQGNVFNDINHGIYLSTNSEEYNNLITLLDTTYGIYNYHLSTKTIIDENGNEIIVVESIDANLEDAIDVLSMDFIYEKDKVSAIEMHFKFYEKSNINKIVTEPYVLSNLQLSDGNGKVYGTSSDKATTTVSENYVYQTIFNLNDPFKLDKNWIKKHDLDNVYLEFNIDRILGNKTSANGFDQSIKLDQETLNSIIASKDIGSSLALIITASIMGLIVLLILLVLLILFLIKKSNERKIAAEGGVQDGYYEFNDYNEENVSNVNNQDYYYDQVSNYEKSYDYNQNFDNKDFYDDDYYI